MSGAEALAVIGIVANIIQLVDFSGKAISRIIEYSGDVHKVPKAFRETQTLLPLITNALQKIQEQASKDQVPEEECKARQPVLEGCEAKLAELKTIFKNALPENGTSMTGRAWMALLSLGKDRKVEKISKALERDLQILTNYHIISAPTALDIAASTETASNVKLGAASATPATTYFMVPPLPMTDFTGREKTMIDLEAKLCLPDKHSRVALVGLGGIGKTRVALEFARKHRKSTDTSVLWVYAHNAERMKTSYKDIARKAAIPGHLDPAVDVLKLVKEWFEDVSPGKWLMIVDNADDSELLYSSNSQPVRYADYLPRSDQGSILLTTRNSRVGKSFTTTSSVITLGRMSIEESEALLSTHLDVKMESHSFKDLAEQLEQIPLALVQAAAFMSQNSVSAETYLQLYRQSDSSKTQLLNEDFEDGVRDPLSKNPVATTWWISFEYIKKHDPQAVELLSFMSMLANRAVLERLLPASDDPTVTFEKALGTLQGFSFISVRDLVSEQSQYRLFDFHRLVRLAMRNWLKSSAGFDPWVAVAISRLAMLSTTNQFKFHDMRSQLLSHAIELLGADALQGASDPKDLPSVFLDRKLKRDCRHDDTICPCCTAELLHCVAFSLFEVGNHTDARAYAQRAMVLKRHILGEADESTLESAMLLVQVTITLLDYGNAKAVCREAIEVSRTKYGLGGYWTMYSTWYMIRLLREEPNSEQDAAPSKELLEAFETGLSQNEASEDPDKLYLALNFHYNAGRYLEAGKYGLRAMKSYLKTPSLMSRKTVLVLSSLAGLGMRLYEYERAEKWGRLSVEVSTRCYGPKDPTTLDSMFILAEVLSFRQKIIEAKALATEALKLTEEVFGKTSRIYSTQSDWYHRSFDEGARALEPSYQNIRLAERPNEDGVCSITFNIRDFDSMEEPKLSPVSDESGGEC